MTRPAFDENEHARVKVTPTLAADDLFASIDGALALELTHEVEVRAHLRTVPGAAPLSGEERKQLALVTLEGRKATQAALAYVRGKLAELYRSRLATWPAHRVAFVNADDADRILRTWAYYPTSLKEKPNYWRGSIWAKGQWEVVVGAEHPSLRPELNATSLPGWRLK